MPIAVNRLPVPGWARSPKASAKPVVEPAVRNRLVLSPHEALVAGGPAEEYEQRVQALFRDGYRHVVTDLRAVPQVDSAGIRAFVRGHTTAQRLGGSFKLVGPNPLVRSTFQLAHLDTVLGIYDTLEAAQTCEWRWKEVGLLLGGVALCAALVWSGLRWPHLQTPGETAAAVFPPAGTSDSTRLMPGGLQPFVELLKLVAAALIGILVTGVQQSELREKPLSRSLVHAQALLCVAGALMMMIIGSSLARAFGIAGAAAIIRFRTPVEDPKDITILFLLMGLGMASGLGFFALAGLGTAFLCIFLWLLEHVGEQKLRAMTVELAAGGREFPTAHVQGVFARNRVVFEPREVSQGTEAIAKYRTTLEPGISLEDLSAQLMSGPAGVKSVSWSSKKS